LRQHVWEDFRRAVPKLIMVKLLPVVSKRRPVWLDEEAVHEL